MYAGRAHLSLGDYARAIQIFGCIVDALTGPLAQDHLGVPIVPSVFARSHLVECLAAVGRFEESARYADEAIALAETTGSPRHHALGVPRRRASITWPAEKCSPPPRRWSARTRCVARTTCPRIARGSARSSRWPGPSAGGPPRPFPSCSRRWTRRPARRQTASLLARAGPPGRGVSSRGPPAGGDRDRVGAPSMSFAGSASGATRRAPCGCWPRSRPAENRSAADAEATYAEARPCARRSACGRCARAASWVWRACSSGRPA